MQHLPAERAALPEIGLCYAALGNSRSTASLEYTPGSHLLLWIPYGSLALELTAGRSDGTVYLLANDLLLLPPGSRIRIVHQFVESPLHCLCIDREAFLTAPPAARFPDSTNSGLIRSLLSRRPRHFYDPDTAEAVGWIRTLTEDLSRGYGSWQPALCWADAARLLLCCGQMRCSHFHLCRTGGQADTLAWVLHYIQENYATASLEEAARNLHYNAEYLSQMLTRCTGRCFTDLLAARRAAVGRELLARQELSLGEIAALLGYRSYSGFFRSFRKSTGLSPSEYRRRLGLHG